MPSHLLRALPAIALLLAGCPSGPGVVPAAEPGGPPAPVAVEAIHARRVTPPLAVSLGDRPSLRAGGPGGVAEFVVQVPGPGAYALWLYAFAADGPVLFRVSIDDAPPTDFGGGTGWAWHRDLRERRLRGGPHAIRLESAAAGAEVARLALIPAGAGPESLAPVGAAPGEPGAIIIDNHAPLQGRFTATGAWHVDPAGGDWNDTPCHWIPPATGPNDTATARWEVQLPTAGKWKVFVWYGDDPQNDHATDAPFTVEYAHGSTTTLKVNEKQNQRRWNLLGTFRFDGAKPAAVTLTNQAGANVIADAVKFVPQ